MRYVYVVVSSIDDYYAEQAMLSIISLKHYNADAGVTLLTDRETYETFNGVRGDLKVLADDIKIVDVNEKFDRFQRSRYMKTSVRNLIDGDFVFLDVDTVVQGDLSELEQIESEIAMVRQTECIIPGVSLSKHLMKEYMAKIGASSNNSAKITDFFNSGVILCRDTPRTRQLYNYWNEAWMNSSLNHDYHWDQPSLWLANFKVRNIIEELDGIYNCRAIYPEYALKYILNCRIFHYSSTSKRTSTTVFQHADFLEKFRENGMTDDVLRTIENVKAYYLDHIEVVARWHYDECAEWNRYLEERNERLREELDMEHNSLKALEAVVERDNIFLVRLSRKVSRIFSK